MTKSKIISEYLELGALLNQIDPEDKSSLGALLKATLYASNLSTILMDFGGEPLRKLMREISDDICGRK